MNGNNVNRDLEAAIRLDDTFLQFANICYQASENLKQAAGEANQLLRDDVSKKTIYEVYNLADAIREAFDHMVPDVETHREYAINDLKEYNSFV